MSHLTPGQTKAMRFAQDVTMVQDLNRWPQWPYLPMKRYVNNRMICAFLTGEDRAPFRLYEVNMWNLSPEAFQTCVEHVYPTAEAMIQDGWTVD